MEYYGNFLSLVWKNLFIGIGLLFSIFGLIKINPRLKALCISWIILSVLPLLVIQTAAFARYFYFALPPFIILASYGLYYLLNFFNNILKASLILLLIVICFFQISTYHNYFTESSSFASPDSASIQDINVFKDTINDNKNVYSRHHSFQYYFPNNNFIAFSDMSEDDAISFLSWDSETAISTIMEKYQIGWIMLYQDERWEKDYYIWIKEVTGSYTRHYVDISNSSNFQLVYNGRVYILYKYIDNSQSL
jgi:branched-subunit amino acid transport protein AzlD